MKESFLQVAVRGEIILPLHTANELKSQFQKRKYVGLPTLTLKNHALSFKNQIRLKSGHLVI